MPGAVSEQQDCNFKYHGQRRTKKMTYKQKLEVDEGILEGALHIEEIAKDLGVQGGKCDWSRKSKGESSKK